MEYLLDQVTSTGNVNYKLAKIIIKVNLTASGLLSRRKTKKKKRGKKKKLSYFIDYHLRKSPLVQISRLAFSIKGLDVFTLLFYIISIALISRKCWPIRDLMWIVTLFEALYVPIACSVV